MTHVRVSRLTIIGSDYSLSPRRRQAIIWTMLEYCQLDPWEQTSVKFQSKFQHFHSRKCVWMCRLRNGGHFVSASMSVLGTCSASSPAVARRVSGAVPLALLFVSTRAGECFYLTIDQLKANLTHLILFTRNRTDVLFFFLSDVSLTKVFYVVLWNTYVEASSNKIIFGEWGKIKAIWDICKYRSTYSGNKIFVNFL